MNVGKHWLWVLLAIPALAGCAMDDDYFSPPPPPGYGYYPQPYAPPSACSAPQPAYYQPQNRPQSQEPPR